MSRNVGGARLSTMEQILLIFAVLCIVLAGVIVFTTWFFDKIAMQSDGGYFPGKEAVIFGLSMIVLIGTAAVVLSHLSYIEH